MDGRRRAAGEEVARRVANWLRAQKKGVDWHRKHDRELLLFRRVMTDVLLRRAVRVFQAVVSPGGAIYLSHGVGIFFFRAAS